MKVNNRLRHTYNGILDRCNNKNGVNYHKYGARGITICEEWESSYESFYCWALLHGYKDNLTIDRIDNDGDYEPNNCRWITPFEQARNRRNSRFVYLDGKREILTDCAKRYGIGVTTVYKRLAKGWNLNKAITTPVNAKFRNTRAKLYDDGC